MFYVNIILVLIISLIPMLFTRLSFASQKRHDPLNNDNIAPAKKKNIIYRLRKKYFNISIKIYNAVKQSQEARKFFSLILLLAIVTCIMIDFNASASIARIVNETAQKNDFRTDKIIGLYNEYRPYITNRYATLLAGIMMIPFFSFKATEKILVWLHDNIPFLVVTTVTIFLLIYFTFFTEGRSTIIIEILFITLGASTVYPRIRRFRDRSVARGVPKAVIDRLYNYKYIRGNNN